MNKNELDMEFNTAMAGTDIRTIWRNRDPDIDYDYSGCVRGRFVAIILLGAGDGISPDQRATRRRIEAAGGIHLTITEHNMPKCIIRIETIGLARQSGADR